MSPQSPQAGKGYLSFDTIAALATAPGGAINILRLSGPRSVALAVSLSNRPQLSSQPPRTLCLLPLYDAAGSLLDQAMIARFDAPKSYTGEDLIEIYCHGGWLVASRILDRLFELGARPALPGEFSFRAVRNGKMTLSQAQAVSDLISTSSEAALRLALEKLGDQKNVFLSDLAEKLRALASLAEAGIDFSDQDLEETSLPTLKLHLAELIPQLQRLRSTFDRGSKMQSGVRVALVGLPNAGKSSFFNALLGEERSIVSEIPGTTRDVVHELVHLRSTHGLISLRVEDTAGLRESAEVIEKIGIERTQKAVLNSDLVLFLVDARELFENPKLISKIKFQWEKLGGSAQKTIGLFTKSDLVPNHKEHGNLFHLLHQQVESLHIPSWYLISSTTGAGLETTTNAITSFCSRWFTRERGEYLVTRQEQVLALEGGIENLTRALHAQENDLFASDLRMALNALAPLIGETLPEDILDRVFSGFCIGK